MSNNTVSSTLYLPTGGDTDRSVSILVITLSTHPFQMEEEASISP